MQRHRLKLLTAFALGGGIACPAVASTLLMCQGAGPSARAVGTGAGVQSFLEPLGGAITLRWAYDNDSQTPAECQAISLSVERKQVVWSTLMSMSDAAALEPALALQGPLQGGAFAVSEIIPLREAAPARPVAPEGQRTETAPPPQPDWRAFGTEERARVEGARLVCEPGRAPAGFLWTPPKPWAGHAPQHLLFQASGQGRVTVGLADAAREQRGDPLEVGTIVLKPTPGTTRLTVPANAQPWRTLSLACPPEGAVLETTGAALRGQLPGLSAWVWSPAAWADAPGTVWALQQRHALHAVYVTVPTEEGAVRNVSLLREFIAESTKRGLHVWAVIGDPADVLADSQAALTSRLKAYARYNEAAPPAARLAGLQMDIEPYLLSGYRLDPPAWRERYLQTVAAARRALAAEVPLDLVVPVWWGADAHWGVAALDRLAPLGVSLTVMNYRTDLNSIRAGAEPFLAWSARHERRVTMALEYGPIPDETRRHYRRSDEGGELWLLPVGQRAALVLLDRPRTGLPGTAFRFTHEAPFLGRQITFAGQPAALAQAVDALTPGWAAWPGFAGIALHGVDEVP